MNHHSPVPSSVHLKTLNPTSLPKVTPPSTRTTQRSDALGVVAAVAAIGAVIGVGKMWLDASLDEIPKSQELVEFFGHVNLAASDIIPALRDLKDKWVTEHASAGALDPAEVENMHAQLAAEWNQAMEQVQGQLLDHYGWTVESLQQSLAIHTPLDAALQHQLMQFQENLIAASNVFRVEVEVPEDLTSEVVLAIVAEITTSLNEILEQILAQDSETSRNLDDMVESWQPQYIEKTQEILAEHDVSQEQLQAAIEKYVDDPEFVQELEKLNQDQQQMYVSVISRRMMIFQLTHVSSFARLGIIDPTT